jgi:hypothetical protein
MAFVPLAKFNISYCGAHLYLMYPFLDHKFSRACLFIRKEKDQENRLMRYSNAEQLFRSRDFRHFRTQIWQIKEIKQESVIRTSERCKCQSHRNTRYSRNIYT